MRATAAVILFALSAQAAFADSEADRWNLGDLYPTAAAWNADADKLKSQFAEMAACNGHLGDGAARFGQCLDLRYDMQKRYYRMNAIMDQMEAILARRKRAVNARDGG